MPARPRPATPFKMPAELARLVGTPGNCAATASKRRICVAFIGWSGVSAQARCEIRSFTLAAIVGTASHGKPKRCIPVSTCSATGLAPSCSAKFATGIKPGAVASPENTKISASFGNAGRSATPSASVATKNCRQPSATNRRATGKAPKP